MNRSNDPGANSEKSFAILNAEFVKSAAFGVTGASLDKIQRIKAHLHQL